MSLLASRFINPLAGSSEWKALAKALDENPRVVEIGIVEQFTYFQVNSTRDLDVSYPVRVWEDTSSKDITEKEGELYISARGDFWIECFCAGATPPPNKALQDLIAWLPKTCYHSAAVAIYMSSK